MSLGWTGGGRPWYLPLLLGNKPALSVGIIAPTHNRILNVDAETIIAH